MKGQLWREEEELEEEQEVQAEPSFYSESSRMAWMQQYLIHTKVQGEERALSRTYVSLQSQPGRLFYFNMRLKKLFFCNQQVTVLKKIDTNEIF